MSENFDLKSLDPITHDFLVGVLSSIRLQIDNVIACLILEPTEGKEKVV